MLNYKILINLILYLFPAIMILNCKNDELQNKDWPIYRGGSESTGYSNLSQINKNSVIHLDTAWSFRTGDAAEGSKSTIQCNPIVVNHTLFLTSPKLQLMALNPLNGKLKWKFNPFENTEASGVNRGVTYWESGNDKRIFFSAGSFLYALNAENGSLISSFGINGKIDLREGLGREPKKLSVWATSPGIIFKNILIQGTALGEGYDAAPGFVRGFDVISGKTIWTFHTIPQPGEFGYKTWEKDAYKQVGGVNCWAGMCLDEKRGTVFIPLGSPAFDFYGGNRKGENLFGNCLLAVNAETGQRKWHYQLVHHDLWDYDLPAPPTLVSVNKNGKRIDAVAQVTKMGMVFIFDRETGKPIFPIEERAVPKSDLLSEEAWPTQPFPVKPAPFVRHQFSENDITDISTESSQFIKEKLKGVELSTIYSPPSTKGRVQFPGTRGGAEWGGASYDPETNILYINANEVPMLFKMKVLEDLGGKSPYEIGENIYKLNNCSNCHAADRTGVKPFPTLLGLSKKRTKDQINSLLKSGRNQMTPFPNISGEEKEALLAFLFDEKESKGQKPQIQLKKQAVRYIHDGWNVLYDQFGYPGVKPPWGTFNAINLNTGEYVWRKPLGEFSELTKKGLPPTGTQNLGGSIVTAGGLVFIAATKDEKFRAFDKATGEVVWEYKLPAGGYATPSTYAIDGKQYIVIACGGGGKVGSKSGDYYLAFCLKGDSNK